MELEALSFPILFSFLIFMLMVLKIGKRFKTHDSLSLPPGPWKLPIFGNMHNFASGLPPHRALRELAKKHGPLMMLRLGEVSTLVVTSAEYAKEVMKTHDAIFAYRPSVLSSEILSYDSTNIGFAPLGNYWRQLRKICVLELLSPKRVESYKSLREDELSNLIKLIGSKAGSTVNLSRVVFSTVYGITSRAAFGNKCGEQERFIEIMKEVIKLFAGFNIADFFPSIKVLHVISGVRPRLETMHKVVDSIMQKIINDHMAKAASAKAGEAAAAADQEDLVDVLLKFHEQAGDSEFSLTFNNIKAVMLDIFAAGSETSAITIIWAMSQMMKNPEVMKKAQAEVREVFNAKGLIDETAVNEMKYLKLLVKETLRLHPPSALLLPRESSERCELNGYEIPAKTKVIVNAWAISRDPKYWTDPESFKPERFIDSSHDFKGTNFEYLPFGAGRRVCPGTNFGLANVEYAIALLLYHFDWKLPNGMKPEDLDMTDIAGATVGRKEDLQLIPIAYTP
ncbi:cytochrome P450 71D11-like [Corylus avellana]|uniref:cytochrome P450 71D11-like n=1 Tax=Corylus avellana TaxID=13451 RepID=UPI00286CF1D1|nr:cytochrome P450 71D11-like [Corylus avellana]